MRERDRKKNAWADEIERGSQREGNDFGLLTNLLLGTIESSLAPITTTTTAAAAQTTSTALA